MSSEENQIGEFCWNRLMTSNIDESSKFYCELFGWGTRNITVNGLPISVFTKDNKKVAGLMKIPDELQNTYKPYWLSFIAVENIHVAVHKAKKMGATMALPVTSLGIHNGLGAIIFDPLGAPIGLWQESEEIY